MDNTKIQQLEKRVAELEQQFKLLTYSDTLPDNFIRSLVGRGFIKTGMADVPPYEEWYLNSGFGFNIGGDDYAQAMARWYYKIPGRGNMPDLFIPLMQLKETE